MDSHACSSIAKGNLVLLAESFSLDLHSSLRCLALAYIACTLQGSSLIHINYWLLIGTEIF